MAYMMEGAMYIRSLREVRVQVPNVSGLWSQKPYPEWLNGIWDLGPDSSNIAYLDPLGEVQVLKL